jgi:hypothetical protein
MVEQSGQPVLRHLSPTLPFHFQEDGSFVFPIAARISSMALFQNSEQGLIRTCGFVPQVYVSNEFCK